jgi:transposase-like protein
MKRKRHTPEQIVAKLRQAEEGLAKGTAIEAICRQLGVSEQTLYRWRNQYGGLKASEAKRLKELERENTQLKKIVARLIMEIEGLRDLLSKKW